MKPKKTRPVMNRRRYLVEIAVGDWGKEESRAVLPRLAARRLARHRIRDTSPVSRFQGVGVTAPGGIDEMPHLLGQYRDEIRREWGRTVAI